MQCKSRIFKNFLFLIIILASILWNTHVFVIAAQQSIGIAAFVPEKLATIDLDFSTGGTHVLVNLDDTSAEFTFPADFYSENLRFDAISYSNASFILDKPPPSGKSFIGKIYDFNFYPISGGSAILTLLVAPTIVLHYLDSDVSELNESTIAPYRRGASDTSWALISGATIDTTANTITFATTTFSTFAILGAPACSDGVDNDGDGKTDYPSDPGCSSTSDNDETDPAPDPAPSPSGGGGVGIISMPTGVTLSGRAYPKSTVTALKDAQIAATTIAGADANFQISVSGISGGNYIFSVYSEDNKGIRSSLLTFPISLTSGATTKIGGIFIAPTTAVDKSEVKRGDNIAIFGQSAPQADIIISVNSEEEFFAKTVSDKDGIYLHNFDTAVLDYGVHYTKSKASIGNLEISSFSRVISFKVGTKNIMADPSKIPAKGDINNDGRVNLVDFSIAAFWYKRPSPPATVDLNSDGKVDLVDFSIMAFYWTG